MIKEAEKKVGLAEVIYQEEQVRIIFFLQSFSNFINSNYRGHPFYYIILTQNSKSAKILNPT